MAAMPVCTVCKRHKDWFDERDERRRAEVAEATKDDPSDDDGELFVIPERKTKPDWCYTSDRLAVSQVQIMYKLYEVLKREFLVGYICTECLALLEQADSLQFQLHAVTKALRDRVDASCRKSKVKKPSDVVNAREGYRQRFKELREKKKALIQLECEDTRNSVVPDEELPIVSNARPQVPDDPQQGKMEHLEEEDDDYGDEELFAEDENEKDDDGAPEATASTSNGDKPEFNLNMSFWSNISDETYLKQVLAKQNFDADFSIFNSSRGQEMLLYDGHLWTVDHNHKPKKTSKIVKAWLCNKKFLRSNQGRSTMRQGTGCRSRLATLADDSKVVLDSVEIEHNHESNNDEVKHESFVCKLKEIIANDPSMEATQVVATAEVMYGKIYSKSFRSMVNLVTGIQRKLGVSKRPRGMDAMLTNAKQPRYQGELEKGPESWNMDYDYKAESHQ